MRIRLSLTILAFSCLSCNLTIAQTKKNDLFEEEFLNSFFKACYIDTTNSHVDDYKGIKISYISNGYGGHWQIFGVNSKGNVVLRFDQETKPASNDIIIRGYNNSGLTCYAIVDWEYDKGHIYKPRDGSIKRRVFDRISLPLNKIGNEFIPPFHIKKSIRDFAVDDSKLRSGAIPFSTPVINPDNILYISKEIASSKTIDSQFESACLNPNTHLGYYVKQSWRGLYNPSKDRYDFSPLHKFFRDCIEYHTSCANFCYFCKRMRRFTGLF